MIMIHIIMAIIISDLSSALVGPALTAPNYFSWIVHYNNYHGETVSKSNHTLPCNLPMRLMMKAYYQGSNCPSLPGLTHWVNPGLPGLGFKSYFGKVGNTGE